MKINNFSIISVFILSIGHVGCNVDDYESLDTSTAELANSVDDSIPAEEGLNLIFKTQISNGNTLEFYEPLPGELIVSELGAVPTTPALASPELSDLSALEILQVLAPDEKPPAVLLKAQRRVQEYGESNLIRESFTSDEPMDSDANRSADPGSTNAIDDSRCPASWFTSQLCGSGDWQVCWTYRTGSTWFQRVNNRSSRANVCSYRGYVTMTFRYTSGSSWYTYGSWTINPGYYRYVNRYGTHDMRSDVTNASGDGYHHSGWGYRN